MSNASEKVAEIYGFLGRSMLKIAILHQRILLSLLNVSGASWMRKNIKYMMPISLLPRW